jgi:Trypsin-co-occurring domain 2
VMAEVAAGLSDAITSIRSELTRAMASGEGEEIRFRLGPVELEFELEARKDAGATAGVKFWVITAAAKGDVSSGSAHRIRLTLQPVTTEGADVEVAADRREPPPRWPEQGS